MIRSRSAARLLCVAALGAAAACGDGTMPNEPARVTALRPVQAPDLATLARTVPGFGGLFLDRGVPTVYLTNPAERGPIERALGAFVRARGFAPGEIRVLPARFAYSDLDRWTRNVTDEAFTVAGVVYTDLDEATNRVAVGVEPGTSKTAIRRLAARLGVPAEAIDVRETEPIYPMTTLRDQVRPVVAGLQIRFSGFLCSLGFNAVSGGQASFVTASHCTDRQGRIDGTEYYQPLNVTPSEFIGTEVDDPSFFRGGVCPRGRKCRFSDAARAAYASGVPNTLGAIARTTGPNNGSLEIDGTFTVTEEGPAVVGDVANKVGRTTGWTQGTVTATCVNTGVFGSNIALLCQDFVENTVQIVGGGDSGSDVFARIGGRSSVRLLGILWGGNSTGTLFVYSPIANVEQELGPLTTF